ncbi:MAG: M48 family metallopeptidase [Phycisphaerales bacterium]
MNAVMTRLAGVCAAAVVALGLAGCKTNPATGERYFSMTSSEQIAAMGVQAAPELTRQFGGEVPSAPARAYVKEIGLRLAAQVEPEFKNIPWEFTLLNSPVVNAFALPGGKIFISRGLVEQMSDEAQLAGVLGHEVGHVTAEHIARRIGQQQLFQIGMQASGLAVNAAGEAAAGVGQVLLPALNVGGQLTLLKFGREEESQADELGIRYMIKAGYDPKAQLQVMEILKGSENSSRPPEFLSTHPMPETRIRQVQGLLNGQFREAANSPNLVRNQQQFQSRLLSVLRSLPPAPEPQASPEPEQQPQQLRGQRQQIRATPERRAPPPDQVIGRPR